MKTKRNIFCVRIEDKDGNGVFHSTLHFSITYPCLYSVHNKMNCLQQEFGWKDRKCTEKYYCAYRSISHLKEFFDIEGLRKAIEIGFKINILLLKKAKIGKHQIFFKKENIVKMTEIKIKNNVIIH